MAWGRAKKAPSWMRNRRAWRSMTTPTDRPAGPLDSPAHGSPVFPMEMPMTPPPDQARQSSTGTAQRIRTRPGPRLVRQIGEVPRLDRCPVCWDPLEARVEPNYRACTGCGTATSRPSGLDIQDGYHFHDLQVPEPSPATTLDGLKHLEAGLTRAAELEQRRLRPGRERILHLGCGRGNLVEAARAAGHNIFGVDVSAPSLRACERRGQGSNCRLTPSLGTAPEGWAGRFDAVLAIELLEHFERPLEVMQAARHYLRPGGWLIGTTRNGRSHWRKMLGECWPGVAWPQYHPSILEARGIEVLARVLSAGPVWTETLCDRSHAEELLEARVVRDSRAPRTNLRRRLLTAALWPSERLRQLRAGRPGAPEGDTLRFGLQI